MYKKYNILVCLPKEIRVIRIIRLKFVLNRRKWAFILRGGLFDFELVFYDGVAAKSR